MKTKRTILFYYIILSLLIFCFECEAQRVNSPFYSPFAKKCYENCSFPDQYETKSEEFYVFTGTRNKNNRKNVKRREIIIKPERGEWVAKYDSENCFSSNKEDCTIKCYVVIPEEVETIWVVKDTTLTKDFEKREIYYEELVMESYSEEREILCRSKITPAIIDQIQNALRKRSYYTARRNTSIPDLTTTEALKKYQRDNGLPVGKLDMETLNKLEIVIPYGL